MTDAPEGAAGTTRRVALPTENGRTLVGFGLARIMLVADVASGRIVRREERLSPDPEHTDPRHHQLMVDLARDCDVVIARHMGPNMATSLRHLAIRVLLAPSLDAAECLDAFARGEAGGEPLLDFPSWSGGASGGPGTPPF